MENLRKIEESEARTKWENIIQYCKEVSVPCLKCLSYHHEIIIIHN